MKLGPKLYFAKTFNLADFFNYIKLIHFLFMCLRKKFDILKIHRMPFEKNSM